MLKNMYMAYLPTKWKRRKPNTAKKQTAALHCCFCETDWPAGSIKFEQYSNVKIFS